MSASAIIDSLVQMLGSASVFGSNGAGTDYDFMETVSGSCCVVSLLNGISDPGQFGNPRERDREYTLSIEAFSKIGNNHKAALTRITSITDAVLLCLEKDDTLQGQVEKTGQIRWARDLQTVVEAGGAGWLPINFEIDVTEWPDN